MHRTPSPPPPPSAGPRHGQLFEVQTETDCLLYQWTLAELDELATKAPPAVAVYFRNFSLYQIANQLERRSHRHPFAMLRTSTGELERPEYHNGAR